MHLIYRLNAGGAENGIINLVNYISGDRFDVSICAFVGKGPLSYRVDPDRTPLFELDKKEGNDIRLPIKLFRLFRQWKPDIIHSHAWGTLCEGLFAAKVAGIPVFIHGEHGTMQKKKYNVLVQRFVWRFVDQVLSVSREHARQLSKTMGFPLKKIKVIANGVNSSRFCQKEDALLTRSGLSIKPGDIIIGTVGRLVQVKNQKMLIQAFSQLVNMYSNIQLIMVGEGPLRKCLEDLADTLDCSDRIHFIGNRSDVPDLMAAMDIFVLTSHREGMSNTILEAMSSGLPVIATKVGGNPELVVDGRTGLLIPSDNASELAGALRRLIKDPEKRRHMGLAGRTRVEKQFSLQAMVENYEQLYLKSYVNKTGKRYCSSMV